MDSASSENGSPRGGAAQWGAPVSAPRDPPQLVETERLELRAPKVSDAPALTELVLASLPELSRFMPWATADYDLAGCEESIRAAIAAFVTRRDFRYHVFERGSGRVVGSTGIHALEWRVPRCEIGYWIGTRHTGRGYASEAAAALTEVAFSHLGARRIEIRCDDENLASARVAERCGYALNALFTNHDRNPRGELRDTRVYAVIR